LINWNFYLQVSPALTRYSGAIIGTPSLLSAFSYEFFFIHHVVIFCHCDPVEMRTLRVVRASAANANVAGVLWDGLFSSELNHLTPAKRASPSYSSMPYGIIFELSGQCPQRLVTRVPTPTGILPSLAGAEGGESLICTVMFRSKTIV
jgi:hypothetical protein